MNRSKLLAILLLCIVAYVALTPGTMNLLTHAIASTSHTSQPLTTSIAPITSTTGDYRVTGKPTITAAHIDSILRVAHSPAVGTGNAMYAYGVAYAIDPIYALAFFQHESSFGLAGMAQSTHSIGNIRCTQGYACINGYRAYGSWQAGILDWYKLIYWYIHSLHLSTVEQIIPTYAPSGDHNNPAQYVASVEHAVSEWRNAR